MIAIKNLFMFAAILVYLMGAFAAPIENYDSQLSSNSHIKRGALDKWCGGFEMVKPNFDGTSKVKLGSQVTVMWKKGQSDVSRIDSLELLQPNVGLVKTYWSGDLQFKGGMASKVLTFDVPSWANRNKEFMLRAWGRTNSGPDCTLYSKGFMFD